MTLTLLMKSISAPDLTNTSTIASCPASQARCRAVVSCAIECHKNSNINMYMHKSRFSSESLPTRLKMRQAVTHQYVLISNQMTWDILFTAIDGMSDQFSH